jgi:hypothetical protein
MNNTLYWRTSNGGTYVDSFIGDDYNGDGTAQNPYQSLGRAWRGSSGKPGTITCRGYFAEDMADGNHAATIQGDYYGAAIFDGLSTYMLYGFRHTKMIIKNLPLSGDFSVNTRADLAGVGSAVTASIAGYAWVDGDATCTVCPVIPVLSKTVQYISDALVATIITIMKYMTHLNI